MTGFLCKFVPNIKPVTVLLINTLSTDFNFNLLYKEKTNIIDPAEIEELGKNKMVAKKLANKFDFFLSEVPHMGSVGRFLGVVLGPRGKMPRPVPPVVDPGVIAAGLKSTTVVKSRDRATFHATFGTRAQSHEELLKNAMEVYNRVTSKLERGIGNIRSFYIKTSMGPASRIEVIN